VLKCILAAIVSACWLYGCIEVF